MDDTPYRLAYEASVRAIEDQARVLEDIRSRVATLVAAAALVTGFFGQEALTRADAIEPVSWAGLAIASFIATAASAVIILWPVHVRFSVSATEIFDILRDRAAAATPVDAREALTEIATRPGADVRRQLTTGSAPPLGLPERYRVPVDGGRRLDGGALEALMAKKPDNGTPRPEPQWPDISKPDTRGGG